MKPLKMLLMAVMALGAMAGARAETIELAPATGSAFAGSSQYSFADIANLPAGAEHRLLIGDTFRSGQEMTLADLANAAAPGSMPVAGEHVARSPTGSVLSLNGAAGELAAGAVAEDFSYSPPKTAGSQSGANFLFSAAEIPEPADWMTLLCGLVVVGFMARRKR